jgi:hypothetical protein
LEVPMQFIQTVQQPLLVRSRLLLRISQRLLKEALRFLVPSMTRVELSKRHGLGRGIFHRLHY